MESEVDNIIQPGDLLCLVDKGIHGHGPALFVHNLKSLETKPEVNVEKGWWHDAKRGWLKIGEGSGDGKVKFIFYSNNLTHLRNAFQIAEQSVMR